MLRKLRKEKNNADLREQYRSSVKYLNNIIKRHRCDYLVNYLNENNIQKFWKMIRKLQHKEGNNLRLISSSRYNTFYIETAYRHTKKLSVSTSFLHNKVFHWSFPPENNGTFHFQPTSEEDVITILKRLKRNKVGACGINSNVYKDLSQAISNEVSLLINGCFRESIFPICAKKAHVLPIPKVKNSLKLEDYRPISIQTTLSKICLLYTSPSPRD